MQKPTKIAAFAAVWLGVALFPVFADDVKDGMVGGKTAAEWTKELKTGATDKDRGYAAQQLGKFGPKAGKEVVAALVEVLKDNQQVVYYATSALGKMGPDAVKPLIELLKDANPGTRASAANALGGMSPAPKDAVAPLIELLKDKEERVRLSAGQALKTIDPEAAKTAGVK